MSGLDSGRIHAMDALRGSTMLLLVPAHAAGFMAINGYAGGWASGLIWVIHVFRLPLFFTMSGFFLVFLLGRRGLKKTFENRTLRIAVPLVIGMATMVPLVFWLAQKTGLRISGGANPFWGPLDVPHLYELWFLWYLLLLDGVALAVGLLLSGGVARLQAGVASLLERGPIAAGVLAIPVFAALIPASDWQTAADYNLVPAPASLAYYGIFFLVGTSISRNPAALAAVARDSLRWLVVAGVAFVPAAVLFTLRNSASANEAIHLLAIATLAVANCASVLALIGLSYRFVHRPVRGVRYMADASYWIYLFHLIPMVPLVALMVDRQVPMIPAFFVAVAGSLAASLVTYALFVRYSVIGRVLNGRRTRPGTRTAERVVSQPAAPAQSRA